MEKEKGLPKQSLRVDISEPYCRYAPYNIEKADTLKKRGNIFYANCE